MIRERMADNKRYGWRVVFGSWDGLMDDGSGSIVAVVDELCIVKSRVRGGPRFVQAD